jgi:hypothetical protein
MRTMFTQSNKAVHLVSERVGVAILTNPAVGVSAQPVVVKPLSDASLCLKTCVIMRSDNDSRLANEFARTFLRRFEPQILPSKQIELSLSARVVNLPMTIRTAQRDDKTGEDVELEIPYMKAYNVERSDARLPFCRTFVAQIVAHRCKNPHDEARSDTLTY